MGPLWSSWAQLADSPGLPPRFPASCLQPPTKPAPAGQSLRWNVLPARVRQAWGSLVSAERILLRETPSYQSDWGPGPSQVRARAALGAGAHGVRPEEGWRGGCCRLPAAVGCVSLQAAIVFFSPVPACVQKPETDRPRALSRGQSTWPPSCHCSACPWVAGRCREASLVWKSVSWHQQPLDCSWVPSDQPCDPLARPAVSAEGREVTAGGSAAR